MTSVDDHELLVVMTVDVLRVREAVRSYLSDFGLLFAALMVALAAGYLVMIYYLVLWPLKNVQENISLYKVNREPERSPEEIVFDMKEAVDAYIEGMEPFDDLTMMSFAYYGPISSDSL